MTKYAVFWGCTIKVRYPSVEKAARLALEELGIELEEVDGLTCCPMPEAFMVALPEEWRAIAARNLSIIGSRGLDVLVICNGCYETLHKISEELERRRDLKDRMRELLSRLGIELKRASVEHAVDILYREKERIRDAISKPLKNLKIAIHPGCKLYGSAEDRPGKLAELVELLGCEIVEYPLVRLCCGIPYNYADRDASLRERAAVKIRVVRDRGADAMTTFCPGCMLQYELAQIALKKELGGEPIPVLNYMELLALAMGHSPRDIGLALHAVPTRGIVEKLGE